MALELAVSLAVLFSHHGGAGNLDEALTQFARAERALPPGHVDLSSVYSSKAAALLQRYAARGRREDIDAAVAAARKSIPATPAGHRSLSSRYANLTGILSELYNATGDSTILDESITQGRTGVAELLPDSPGEPMVFATLAASLMARFAHLENEADLAQALEMSRLALSIAPPGDMRRFAAMGMLASALRLNFERSGRIPA